MSVQYVVENENTLGYINDDFPSWMGVLAGSVRKGGRDWKNGAAYIIPGITQLRQATRADFAEYRVVVPPDFPDVRPPPDPLQACYAW